MNRHEFFQKRLKELGMYEKNADYDGLIARSVEELSHTFKNQRHSGSSAAVTLDLFNALFKQWETYSGEQAVLMALKEKS